MTLSRYLLTTFTILTAGFAIAQSNDGFDYNRARQTAQQKGIIASDMAGYIRFLHDDYLSHGGSAQNPNPGTGNPNLGTVFLNGNQAGRPGTPGPNTPQNAYCPNAGFEQLTFANWTGSYGQVATGGSGAPFPIYNQTSPTIANSAGNNVGLTNTVNYHTIMTTPATNSVFPSYVGYDSIASRVVGTQTVSEIPVVNPTGGPASVRLNGASANYRASKVNYLMALNPNNKNFSISYALVLENGGHAAEDQPYFSVRVTDQNGILVPGCSQYTITCSANVTNSTSPQYDPLWKQSIVVYDVLYRPWQTFAFDFSNYPAITSVNVEFYVGGCAQGGHYGYAYVDAQCSQGGAVASFCAGSNTSVLTAPAGYSTYQWTGPSGPVTIANGGNTGTATISPVSAGQVFTCAVTAPNGCSSVFTTTVSVTTVSITGVGSTPSCPTGNSGTANVTATGSSLGYSYQWLNSLGSTVGTAQTATGLSPGTYSIVVSSPMCGSTTSTVSVGISPPTFYSLNAPFCGSVAWITKAGGSNYKWYTAIPLAIIPGATTQSLTINSPVAGTQYYLSYTTASGCKDSIKYTLTQVPGGSVYVSNIKSICPGNSNSYAVVNLQTSSPPVYSYTVTGPAGYSSVLNNTNAIKDSVINLSIGTYSTTVFDGQCLYNTTFTVNPFVFTYTLTPTTTTICTSGGTPLTVNFGNNISATCGLDPVVCLTGSPVTLFGSGPYSQNGTTTYPTPYGNWYTYERSQYLIKASDLNAAGINAGKLSSLSFNVLNMNTSITTYPNFSIKMGCTGLASLPNVSSGTGQSFVGGLQTVYSNANQPVSVGWNTHNFSQAYVWDGTSNLLVEVCFGMNTAYNYSQNVSVELKQMPYVASTFHAEDTNPVCGGTQLADNSYGLMGNGQYMIPNMKLGYCGGQNPSNFTYTWTPSAGLTSTNTYSTFANPTTTTIYTVQVNPIGQTNCMQAQTSTITIVNPASPTITAIAPLCTNASVVTLTANPTGGSWLGSGVSPTGVLTPSLSTAGNNTYTYTVGSGTCSAIGNTTISVEQYIPSTITSSINPQCITNPVVPLPTTTNTTGIWSGTGISGTNFDPATGVGTYTLTYSTQPAPIATLCPSSSSITVSVSSITQPTISAAGPYCDSFAPQTMTVNPVGGGTGVWGTSTTGSAISAAGVFSPASSIIGANTITYTLTNGPCVAVASNTIQVVHFISAALTGGTGPFCIYDAGTDLQTLAQNAGGIWSGTGVTGTNFDPAVAGAGTHIVTYSVNPAPSGLCPDHTDLSILVNATPTVVPLAQIYAGCNYPFVANFYTPSVNTGTLIWNYGDNSTNETSFAPSHIYSTPGNYIVTTTYTDNVGCTVSSTVATAVTVYSVPVAAFNASPDVTTVVDGEVSFTNQTSDLTNNTYAWLFTGADGSSDINPTYLFTNSGEYFVRLIAISPYGCSDTAVVKVTVNPDVVLYVPNTFTPNGDGLNDEFQIFLPPTGVDYSTFNLTIYDRWGAVIYRTNDVYKFWNGARNNSGEVVQQDTYVYKISFKDEKKKYYEKVGYVTILSGK